MSHFQLSLINGDSWTTIWTITSLEPKGITSLPVEQNVFYTIAVDAAITIGSTTIPKYSRGIYIASTDAVLLAVDPSKNLYTGFKNGSTWSCRKI